ncbi:hypothetical protein [Escherichia coli]|uniref:hypothetical protein n=1 Tax=Escherichia coli TaxID=562 RepID=UPI0029AA5241|nr:hypothetical protein [Escherichia coli]
MIKKYSEHGSKAGGAIAIDEDCLITGDPWLATERDLEGKTFFVRTIKHNDKIVGEIVYSTTTLIPDNYLDISFEAVSIQGCNAYLNYLKDLEEIKLDHIWSTIKDEIIALQRKGLNPDFSKLPMVIETMKEPKYFHALLDWNLPAREGIDKLVRQHLRTTLLDFDEYLQVKKDVTPNQARY